MTKHPPPSNEDSNSAIKSVAEFVAWVDDKHGGQDVLYRGLMGGLTDAEYKASSSLYRRLLNSRSEESVNSNSGNIFINAANQLIETAKKEGHNYKNGRELPPLELLAELQHHGAATCLIDFTKNPLVALWFACLSPHKNKDGKVIALDTSSADKFGAAKGNEGDIAPFFSSGKLHQWTPPKQNNRIVAQQSVFVFGKPVIPDDETDYSCIIHGESKNRILSELRDYYAISEESLFCDFFGFAREVNGHDKEYRKWTAADYFHFGVSHQQLGELREAVAEYDNAIVQDSKFAEAYYNRGIAKSRLGDHAAAIEDYSQVIDLNPKYVADAYYNRGVAKGRLGDYAAAIEDYNQATMLNPKDAKAYNNRGNAKDDLGDYAAAIEDFNQAIALNPKEAKVYNNRGIVKGHLGDYAAAIEDYSQAIALNPKDAKAYYNRGIAKNRLGDKAGALADFREANLLDDSLKIPGALLKDGGEGESSGGGKE